MVYGGVHNRQQAVVFKRGKIQCAAGPLKAGAVETESGRRIRTPTKDHPAGFQSQRAVDKPALGACENRAGGAIEQTALAGHNVRTVAGRPAAGKDQRASLYVYQSSAVVKSRVDRGGRADV